MSIIPAFKSPFVATNVPGAAICYPDGITDLGTSFIIDFAETSIGNTLPAGAVAVGNAFEDFVSNTQLATVTNIVGITNGAGPTGLIFSGAGAATGSVLVGAAGAYDPNNTPTHRRSWTTWAKLPATPVVQSNVSYLTGMAIAGVGNVGGFYVPATGVGVHFVFARQGGANVDNLIPGTAALGGTVMQLGVDLNPLTGVVGYYLNGLLVNQITLGAFSYITTGGIQAYIGPSSGISLSKPLTANIYRSWQEDITLAGVNWNPNQMANDYKEQTVPVARYS